MRAFFRTSEDAGANPRVGKINLSSQAPPRPQANGIELQNDTTQKSLPPLLRRKSFLLPSNRRNYLAVKPAKVEPFAFADWTWLNGNPRTKQPAFDSNSHSGNQGGRGLCLRFQPPQR